MKLPDFKDAAPDYFRNFEHTSRNISSRLFFSRKTRKTITDFISVTRRQREQMEDRNGALRDATFQPPPPQRGGEKKQRQKKKKREAADSGSVVSVSVIW